MDREINRKKLDEYESSVRWVKLDRYIFHDRRRDKCTLQYLSPCFYFRTRNLFDHQVILLPNIFDNNIPGIIPGKNYIIRCRI